MLAPNDDLLFNILAGVSFLFSLFVVVVIGAILGSKSNVFLEDSSFTLEGFAFKAFTIFSFTEASVSTKISPFIISTV